MRAVEQSVTVDIHPIESEGGHVFAAEITYVRDNAADELEAATHLGKIIRDATESLRFKAIGGPFVCASARNIPVYPVSHLVALTTAGGIDMSVNLAEDMAVPWYMLSKEDQRGEVQYLNPPLFRALKEPPDNWHTDGNFLVNRPSRALLQLHTEGSTPKPDIDEMTQRSTVATDGRLLLNWLEREAKNRKIEADVRSLLHVTSFNLATNGIHGYYFRAGKLDEMAVHPKVVYDAAGKGALTLSSFKTCYYPDRHGRPDRQLAHATAATLDDLVAEYFNSGDAPQHEHIYRLGDIFATTRLGPHKRGGIRFQESELWRCSVVPASEHQATKHHQRPRESKPTGFQQPERLNADHTERYDELYFEITNGVLDRSIKELDAYFAARAREVLQSLSHIKDTDVVAERCVWYANMHALPGITTLEDFKYFSAKY